MCPLNRDPSSITERRRQALGDIRSDAQTERPLPNGDLPCDSVMAPLDDRRTEFDDHVHERDLFHPPIRGISGAPRANASWSRYEFNAEDEFPRPGASAHRNQKGKRKASRSPHRNLHTKCHNPPNRIERVASRKKLAFAESSVIEPREQHKGRLAYDDEDERRVSSTSPTGTLAPSPVMATRHVGSRVKPASTEITDTGRAADDEKVLEFDSQDLLDMIQTESTRTDLISIRDLILARLATGQEATWINRAINRDRPRSSGFYQLSEMATAGETKTDEEASASCQNESVYPPVDTTLSTASHNQSAMTADGESAVVVGDASNLAGSAMTAAMDSRGEVFRSCATSTETAEPKYSKTTFFDEPQANALKKAAALTALANKADTYAQTEGLHTASFAPQAAQAVETVPSPAHPVDADMIEVEVTATTAGDSLPLSPTGEAAFETAWTWTSPSQ